MTVAWAIPLLFFLTSFLGILVHNVYTNKLARRSTKARQAILENLGIPTILSPKFVGFFHPYWYVCSTMDCDVPLLDLCSNAGGGGERVLWTAVAATQREHSNCISLVYTGDVDVTKEQIIAQVKARFAISLDPKSLHFVFLKKRHLVEDATWPRFTLLAQSLGSMILAWEALAQVIPDLYIGEPASFGCCWMTVLTRSRQHGLRFHIPCRYVAY